MRKILVFLMLMMAMGMVFATDDVVGIKEGAVAGGGGAYIPVTLSLSNEDVGQVIIGFATHAVDSAASQADGKKEKATLEGNPTTGVASLSTADKDSTYVFWQIQSSEGMKVELSTNALTYTEGDQDYTIDWKITNASDLSALIDGTKGTYAPYPLYTHEPNGSFLADFDSVKLGMETVNYTDDLKAGNLKPGAYTANLVVKITAVGAEG